MKPLKLFKTSIKLMGNNFEFTIVAEKEEWAKTTTDAAINEIKRIEILLTSYNTSSETYQINAHAGISPIRVSKETYRLIERAIKISDLTQGAFDITYGSIDKSLYNFDINMKAA